MHENPWKILSTKEHYDNPWVNVVEHQVTNPAGNPGIYSVVHFKNLAICVLPLDEAYNTWVVGQYRFPVEEYSWEIPEGGGPLGEKPIDTAVRGLKEETGIVAKKFEEIMQLHLSNSATDEHAFVYLATDLTFEEAEPEESEDLNVKKVHFNEAFEMVMNGEITDGISVAAIFKVKYLIDKGVLKITNQ